MPDWRKPAIHEYGIVYFSQNAPMVPNAPPDLKPLMRNLC
jgi:hypothetical protein